MRKLGRVSTVCVVIMMLVSLISAASAAPDTKVTNVFQDTDVRQALATIAVQAGENLVPDATVSNNVVTLDLKDVPFEEALQMICNSGGYSFVNDGGCYLVGQAIPSNPNFDRFCVTETVKLKNSEAAEVVKVFSQFYSPYVKAGGPRDNVIVITAPKRISQAIRSIISEIDAPKAQITIEALVLEISKVKGRDFSINWSDGEPSAISGGVRQISFADFVFGYTNTLTKNVLVSLKAALQNGVARIRANPRLTVTDGYEASFSAGQKEYFDTSSQNPNGWQTYTKLEIIESGVKMKILPRLAENGEINLTITPDVSDVIGKTENGLPKLNARTMTTTIRVRDGETIVIGGLVSEISRTDRRKVPILGDLPLIGFLFRSTSDSAIKTDLAILITPHINGSSLEANAELIDAANG